MRNTCDAKADAVVKALVDTGEVGLVNRVLQTLVDNDDPRTAELPDVVRKYFDETALILPENEDWLVMGQRVFAEHGPEILAILACYALPAAYAAHRGVQVLASTQLLEKQTTRRLWETTQMVVDCLSPGGLSADGRGVLTAQRVRLMHAGIRHLCLSRQGAGAWNREKWSLPINQEDMAGTLMTFSWIVLDGLHKLGIELTGDEQSAYLQVWLHIGKIMGVDARLLPANVAEAAELTATIQRRQIGLSPEGVALTTALRAALDRETPGTIFDGFSDALMRLFLPKDVAVFLQIPHKPVESAIVWLMKPFIGDLDGAIDKNPRARTLLREFNLMLIDSLLRNQLGRKRPPFVIPTELHSGWRRSSRSKLGLWDVVVMALRRLFVGQLPRRFRRRLSN